MSGEKSLSKAEKDTLYCSFCGKSQHEVQKLIAGPTVFICNECTELCMEILREEKLTSVKSLIPELYIRDLEHVGVTSIDLLRKAGIEAAFEIVPDLRTFMKKMAAVVNDELNSCQSETSLRFRLSDLQQELRSRERGLEAELAKVRGNHAPTMNELETEIMRISGKLSDIATKRTTPKETPAQ